MDTAYRIGSVEDKFLVLLGRYLRVTPDRILHDRFLPQTKIPLANGTSKALRLDLFVELYVRRDDAARKKQRCHLVEIDMGTHYDRAIREKLLLQLRYAQDGYYERD